MALPIHTSLPLSSTGTGTPIIISATAHPAQLIHQSSNNAQLHDYVTLWVMNYSSSPVTVTSYITAIGAATTTSTPVSSVIESLAPRTGKFLLEPGILLTQSQELRVIASIASSVTVSGYVYRRTLTVS